MSWHVSRKQLRTLLADVGLLDPARELRDSVLGFRWFKTNAPFWVRGAPDGLPVPPLRLVRSATGASSLEWAFHSGGLAASTIRGAVQRNGLDLNGFRSILDFGCGFGRVIRHWAGLRADVHGCDCNPASIRWCRRNLRFATFEVNRLDPPLTYSSRRFDFVYALSVLTHLPKPLLKPWMAELGRVLIPGGYLLLTTHGAAYLPQLTLEEQQQFHAGLPVVRNEDVAGTNRCGVYFSEAYIRATLAEGFRVVDFVPEGALGNPHQDLVLLQKTPQEHV